MDIKDTILLVDKPKGITSFDVIRRLRKELGIKKIGHAGTLDPLATGLMIIGVGEGTKKLNEYLKLPKEYVAEILIGEKRTTGDMEGEVIEQVEVSELDGEQVRDALRSMVGILRLSVSAYSAVKKGGMPMYKRARKVEKTGEDVGILPIRDMEVMQAELLGIENIAVNRDSDSGAKRCIVSVRFYVGSGTYIRSLAEELGRRLGYPATLNELRRTKIGEFTIESAESL